MRKFKDVKERTIAVLAEFPDSRSFDWELVLRYANLCGAGIPEKYINFCKWHVATPESICRARREIQRHGVAYKGKYEFFKATPERENQRKLFKMAYRENFRK